MCHNNVWICPRLEQSSKFLRSALTRAEESSENCGSLISGSWFRQREHRRRVLLLLAPPPFPLVPDVIHVIVVGVSDFPVARAVVVAAAGVFDSPVAPGQLLLLLLSDAGAAR